MDRVREAVFNSLNSHGLVEGCTFLDAFAGSGALGLEALSRGAAHVTFVDRDRRSVAVVQENLEALAFTDRATTRLGDGVAAVGTAAVDVALLDPPYEFDAWESLLASTDAEAVVIESDRPVEPGERWRILKQKRYAGTVVAIARRADTTVSDTGEPTIRQDVER